MKVITKSSVYVIEDDMVTRHPVAEDASDLRKDDEAHPLLEILQPPVVGRSMILLIDVRGDGVATVRTTTPVVEVQP